MARIKTVRTLGYFEKKRECEKNIKKPTVFHKENLQQEVKKLNASQREKKKLKRLVQTVQASASSFVIAIPVSAQEVGSATKDLPTQEQLLEIAQWAITYATTAIVVAGCVWIVVSRVLHFLPVEKYKKMALDIATNTIKGITEALLIPTIIGIIVGVSFLLFGGVPVFNLP